MQTITIIFALGLILIAIIALAINAMLDKRNAKLVRENETAFYRRLNDIENGN